MVIMNKRYHYKLAKLVVVYLTLCSIKPIKQNMDANRIQNQPYIIVLFFFYPER